MVTIIFISFCANNITGIETLFFFSIHVVSTEKCGIPASRAENNIISHWYIRLKPYRIGPFNERGLRLSTCRKDFLTFTIEIKGIGIVAAPFFGFHDKQKSATFAFTKNIPPNFLCALFLETMVR